MILIPESSQDEERKSSPESSFVLSPFARTALGFCVTAYQEPLSSPLPEELYNMIYPSLWVAFSLLIQPIRAVNFPFEEIQLTAADVSLNQDVDFGNATLTTQYSGPACKAFPGSQDWPAEEEWSALNETIDGVLLRPLPIGSACYAGGVYDAARCRYLTSPMSGLRHVYIDDPLTVLTQWPQGATCTASLKPQGNCTQGGFPVYVVNVTAVKHVQAAVNFARNKNIRLVIKYVWFQDSLCECQDELTIRWVETRVMTLAAEA